MANLSDQQAIKEKDKKDKRDRELEIADLKHILSSPQGRRFIWRYLKYCDRISFSHDALMMAFNDGERNISLQMKAEAVEADGGLYLLMQSEAIQRETNNG